MGRPKGRKNSSRLAMITKTIAMVSNKQKQK